MSEELNPTGQNPVRTRKRHPFILNIFLFIATFITTTIAGTQWANKDFTDVNNWQYGVTYAILILTFLGSHEFGHYFAARYHKVNSTLPFFIPFTLPFMNGMGINFGTFGAVIRTRTPIPNRKALFDIGVSGPLAGFVVCLIILIIGFQTLPPKEYIYHIHPEYLTGGGGIPKTGLHFGDTILYPFLAKIFANPHGWLPPMNEIYHYPFLCVGWFGLFVTTLNMLPIGQLDGGHITFAMFGWLQRYIGRVAWWAIILLGIGSLLGIVSYMLQIEYDNVFYIALQDFMRPILAWLTKHAPWYLNSWGGWLFWGLLTRFVIRIAHPPVWDMKDIGTNRKIIGWISLIILFLSFSWNGIYFTE